MCLPTVAADTRTLDQFMPSLQTHLRARSTLVCSQYTCLLADTNRRDRVEKRDRQAWAITKRRKEGRSTARQRRKRHDGAGATRAATQTATQQTSS